MYDGEGDPAANVEQRLALAALAARTRGTELEAAQVAIAMQGYEQ